jgi:carbonic anhydrase
MSETESQLPAILEANRAFAASFDKGDLEIPPARPVLVLTCIDARLDPATMLGLEIGDAHVLRNAGGRVTGDAIRSATISSWLLGTREFLVIHHTDCGMTKFTDDVLHGMIQDATGIDVSDEEYLPFSDMDESVREDVARLRDLKTLPEGVTVAGLVYDVRTGELREVDPA